MGGEACRGRRGPHLSDEVQILQTANAEWQVRESVDSARPCARYGPALAYHSGKVRPPVQMGCWACGVGELEE